MENKEYQEKIKNWIYRKQILSEKNEELGIQRIKNQLYVE